MNFLWDWGVSFSKNSQYYLALPQLITMDIQKVLKTDQIPQHSSRQWKLYAETMKSLVQVCLHLCPQEIEVMSDPPAG